MFVVMLNLLFGGGGFGWQQVAGMWYNKWSCVLCHQLFPSPWMSDLLFSPRTIEEALSVLNNSVKSARYPTLVHTLYLPPVQLFMLDPNFPPSHTHLTSLSFSKGQCYWSGVCVCVCVFWRREREGDDEAWEVEQGGGTCHHSRVVLMMLRRASTESVKEERGEAAWLNNN